MSGSDIRDILQITKPTEPVPRRIKQQTEKRPEGVSRELFSLIGGAAPAAFHQPTYKAKLNVKKKATPWVLQPFTNSARLDDLTLKHWIKAGLSNSQGQADSTFAKFDKAARVIEYSDKEYDTHLTDPDWTREETDYLLQLCRQYELRFIVIQDRYHFGSQKRTIEDLKDRYYTMLRTLIKARSPESTDHQTQVHKYAYDKTRELERKEALQALSSRTKEQVEEEQALLVEANRIEQQAERLARDRENALQLIHPAPLPTRSSGTNAVGKKRKKGQDENGKGRGATPAALPVEEKKGVYLRRERLSVVKQGSLQQKVIKVMDELSIASRPIMATAEVCRRYERLQNSIVGLFELKKVVDRLELEGAIRHNVAGTEPRPKRGPGAGASRAKRRK